MGAEAALVRCQLVSGTHAISTALFACLRPGDRLVAVAGRHADRPLRPGTRPGSCFVCSPCVGRPAPQVVPGTWLDFGPSKRPQCRSRLQRPSLAWGTALLCFSVMNAWSVRLCFCRPYDTLEEVIGLRGAPSHGSLAEWCVSYDELPLAAGGTIDWAALPAAITPGSFSFGLWGLQGLGVLCRIGERILRPTLQTSLRGMPAGARALWM